MLPHDPRRESYWRSRLNETPWTLDTEAQLITLQSMLTVCAHRGWLAHAIHVRTNHVHGVISGDVLPERMLSDFKAYATRGIRSAAGNVKRRRYWTDHGSTRYLWNVASLRTAIDYVVNGQGVRMACYSNESEVAHAPGSDSASILESADSEPEA